MINHALAGFANEIEFVKSNNNNKSLDNPIWNFLVNETNLVKNLEKTYLVKVSNKVPSKIHKNKINAKSDVYLISGDIPNKKLIENEFFIEEKDIKNLNHSIINYSGISLKKDNSKNYQIMKISPESFNELIGPYELGAGASLYCEKEKEIYKNNKLIMGWKCSMESFKSYFSNIKDSDLIDNPTISDSNKALIYKEIKNYSTTKIKNIIMNDSTIANVIFKGEKIFEEPYVAHYIVTNGCIKYNTPYNFYVTTGSGRSKGIYTLEFKPKK